MTIFRILVLCLAFTSPALAQDGAKITASAQEASKAFHAYIDGLKKDQRPDPYKPEVAALLARIFDADALNALPPAKPDDLAWMPDWMQTANDANKTLLFFGAMSGPQPDMEKIGRNMAEYEDQYAKIMNFLIRAQAREALAMNMFMVGLAPADRTKIREDGYTNARHGASEMIIGAIGAVILNAKKPENIRLVSGAIRDTREVWVGFFLPQDRERYLKMLDDLPKRVSDDKAREDLVALQTALKDGK
ncbi:MAG: hypothetical protein AB1342_13990 [Pseudomonadota bacterium]